MGAHRLWAHRSFKATFPLRAVLVLFQTISLQQHIHEWTQNHRIHHKYSETDADPHNAKRGLFFSHIGWMMYEKHPEFTSKIQRMDMKDIENDCLVMWQKKHYLSLALLVSFIIPTLVPWLCWGEHLLNAVMVPAFLRCLVLYHITWSVNSLAHWTGGKPYEKNIYPSQNAVVAFLAMGEGWHNYHHVFPWDYKTSEFGGFTNINFTTLIIKLCSKVGLAYDLKTVTPEMIEKRARRTGDGTYKGPSK
ncbi:hypothetical protein Pcinc_018458 [Petrolisthes cinctipes]|uniref:Fatty acid desaturase domain-containing protein n=1 Tax=Petrolisthes cinctipes TaxID=88211 RepID=A0AAE1FNI3_PETCI|nr:hypothetical protein Pcinc_018458 [Petrolisthes cinctipes]